VRPAEHLDRLGRAGLLHGLPVLVLHGPDLGVDRAGHDGVAHVERPSLHQDRGDGAAALVEVGLYDHASSRGVGVGLELLQVGDEQEGLE
jgi:hypothetical protein